MKKIGKVLLVLVLAIATGCSSNSSNVTLTEETGIYTPGSYSASEFGMLDDVIVTVEFDANSIVNVTIEGNETENIGSKAIAEMPQKILDAQSSDVDVITGATVTSTAIITALNDCIAQAKGETIDETATLSEMDADVVVVGAGAAGLAAAASAAEEGATVIVIEANGRVGGSTSLSGGHMTMIDESFNATLERNDDDLQKYLDYDEANFPNQWGADLKVLKVQINEYLTSDTIGKFDSIERCMVDHYLSGNGKDKDGNPVTLDYDLIRKAVDANMDINNWLVEKGGMVIADKPYNQHGNTPNGTGAGLIEALNNAATSYEQVTILLNTTATDLIVEDGNVTGVKAVDKKGNEINCHAADGVVLATGSFSSNAEMAAKYQNIGTGLSVTNGSTNPETNQGAGIVMAEAAGAQLRDMQFMCVLVYGINNGATVGDWGKIGSAASLIVNANGERFANEAKIGWMEGAKNANIINQPEGKIFAIGSEAMLENLNSVSETFVTDMENAGVLVIGDTLEEACTKANLDYETVASTVEQFNSYVDNGTDSDFARDSFNGKVEQGKVVIGLGQACYHLTFGGLVIDTEGHVLDGNNQPIESLFAAGDVISGIEGITHISCECLTSAIYYGQVSGINAYLNR